MFMTAAGERGAGIESSMRFVGSVLVVSWLAMVLIVSAAAGPSGSFRGYVVERPAGVSSDWIYVRGRNGMLRRVEVSQAVVEYDEEIPAAKRSKAPREALVEGAEVRVTAEQGKDGEWRASRVEILPGGEGSGRNLRRGDSSEAK